MMVIKCIASVLIAGACLNVLAVRDVSVSYANKGTGRVNLAFGAAEAGVSNHLYAVWSAQDRGADSRGWDQVRRLGFVKSETSSFTYVLPPEWTAQKGVVRFFLTDAAYDWRIDHCSSTYNGAYVDTEYKPGPKTEMTVEHQSLPGVAPFGVTGYLVAFNNNATEFFSLYFGDNSKALPCSACSRWCTTRIGPQGTFIDDELVYRAPQTTFASCDYAIHLFQRSPSDKGTDVKHGGTCAIRRAEIREDGVLVRRYVPCVSGGVVGLYEAFEKRFLTIVNGKLNAPSNDAPHDFPALEDAVDFSVTPALAFGARLPIVSAFDRETGSVTLTFSSGTAKQLFALHDIVDRGFDHEAWSNVCYVADIAASDTSYVWTLPNEWLTSMGAIRFVLTDPEDLGGAVKKACLKSSTGDAYVETGIIPDVTTSMRMRFRANSGAAPFGVAGKFVFFCNGDGTFPIFFGLGDSISPTAFPYSSKTVYSFRIGPEGAMIDGRRYSGAYTFPTGTAATSPMVIVGRRDDGKNTRSKVGGVDVYSAYIETNGVPARSYVACVKDGQNVLYDRISKTFFGNAGIGSFGIGADAGPELLRENEKSMSAVLNIGPVVKVLSVDRKTGAISVRISGATGSGALYLAAASEDMGAQPSEWPVIVRLSSFENPGVSVDWEGTVDVAVLQKKRYVRLFVVSREPTPFGTLHDSLMTYGSYYLNSGIKPDSTCEAEVEYSGNAGTLLGASFPFGTTNSFAVVNLNGNDFRYSFFGNGGMNVPGFSGVTDGVFHKVILGPGGLYVDGSLRRGPFEAVKGTLAETLLLLRSRELTGACTIRRFVLRQNGFVVRDMVPCRHDGVNGMWDYQSQSFFKNANSTGASVLGTEVFMDRLTDENVAGVSDAQKIVDGMMIIFR